MAPVLPPAGGVGTAAGVFSVFPPPTLTLFSALLCQWTVWVTSAVTMIPTAPTRETTTSCCNKPATTCWVCSRPRGKVSAKPKCIVGILTVLHFSLLSFLPPPRQNKGFLSFSCYVSFILTSRMLNKCLCVYDAILVEMFSHDLGLSRCWSSNCGAILSFLLQLLQALENSVRQTLVLSRRALAESSAWASQLSFHRWREDWVASSLCGLPG